MSKKRKKLEITLPQDMCIEIEETLDRFWKPKTERSRKIMRSQFIESCIKDFFNPKPINTEPRESYYWNE